MKIGLQISSFSWPGGDAAIGHGRSDDSAAPRHNATTEIGQQAALDVTLKVGSISTSVEVSGQQQILLDLIRSAQKEGRIQYADPFLKAAAAENRETSTETEPADK